MTHHAIATLDDARLAPYRHLKETNATRWSNTFVAEGEKLVDRLIASGLAIESLLAAPAYAERFSALMADDVPVLVVPPEWIEQIIGFNFHRGVLACARRPTRRNLDGIRWSDSDRTTLVICPDVQDPENLGVILRNSAAFGVDAILVGPHSADPFSRRVLRVSMGAAFRLPIIESVDLEADLRRLRSDWNVELWATVLRPGAKPLMQAERPRRLGLLFGSEGHGLADRWIDCCDAQFTIPMAAGTDSLNVAVASGIFLYEVTRAGTAGRSTTPPV
jgi:tRNA G18 (ribose-2'-O)-methylase SpoU